MKIFAIRDEAFPQDGDQAYLIYYEKQKVFYIEVPEDKTEWEVPLLVSSFVKRGEYTLNAYWSKLWVSQRIVPPDRQNLGQILRDNGLEEYDEYELLMLGHGRCAQDSCYLARVEKEKVAERLRSRFQRKVEDVVPLKDWTLLVFFRDGETRRCRLEPYFLKHLSFRPVYTRPGLFETVKIQAGGYGVCWNEDTVISDKVLHEMGERLAISREDFQAFAEYDLVNAAEAARILDCTRQNIEKLVRTGKLHPVKNMPRSTLFLRSEVVRRTWE